MTPIKIEIDIDDMGVSARVFVDGKQKEVCFNDRPAEPVSIAFMVRGLVEKYT